MGPIQVCVHAVCLVNQLIVIPKSALKVSVCKTRSFKVVDSQTLPVGSVSKKMNLFGTAIAGVLTLFEICNKVLYQNFYIKLVF